MLQLTDSSKQRASIKNQITESNGKIEKLKAELENPMSFHMDEDVLLFIYLFIFISYYYLFIL